MTGMRTLPERETTECKRKDESTDMDISREGRVGSRD